MTEALNIAIGILLATGAIVVVLLVLLILVGAYLLLWHGIDDYGPLKHQWLKWRKTDH